MSLARSLAFRPLDSADPPPYRHSPVRTLRAKTLRFLGLKTIQPRMQKGSWSSAPRLRARVQPAGEGVPAIDVACVVRVAVCDQGARRWKWAMGPSTHPSLAAAFDPCLSSLCSSRGYLATTLQTRPARPRGADYRKASTATSGVDSGVDWAAGSRAAAARIDGVESSPPSADTRPARSLVARWVIERRTIRKVVERGVVGMHNAGTDRMTGKAQGDLTGFEGYYAASIVVGLVKRSPVIRGED